VRFISTLFQQYATDADLSPRTIDDWSKMIAHFEEWLNGKPADKVTPADILQYGEYVRDGNGLSKKRLSAKRVNEGYLAAIRSTYAWATKAGRELVSTNPARGVTVTTPKSEKGYRRRAYTRVEVTQILSAARSQTTPYRRWLPWLLAFTGARVSEILNAKVADITQVEGVWCIHFRPQAKGESGERQKTVSANRYVPFHPTLLAEGFLAYVESLPADGHLFPGKWKDQHRDRTKTPANRLRDWIHTVHPPEDGVAPNHSFRHWLVNECKRAKIDEGFRNKLMGHSSAGVAGNYGSGEVPELMEALSTIPSPFN
jgi:integrase